MMCLNLPSSCSLFDAYAQNLYPDISSEGLSKFRENEFPNWLLDHVIYVYLIIII